MGVTRRRKVALAIGLVPLIAVLAFAWALLWPGPKDALRCLPGDAAGCRAATGRVAWIPAKDRADRSRPLHLVLISRQSVALPAITLVKIPTSMRPPGNPGVGRWVSVVGTLHRGSNGRPDLDVTRLLMP